MEMIGRWVRMSACYLQGMFLDVLYPGFDPGYKRNLMQNNQYFKPYEHDIFFVKSRGVGFDGPIL